METKICAACKKDLPITEFYFRKEKGHYRSCCKKCKRVNTKEEVKAKATADTKVCKHCGIEKPVSEYQKAGGGKWNQPYCMPCDAKRKRKHTEENKEHVVKKRKQYYKDNKELITERTKDYRNKNIDAVRKRSRDYREANMDKVRKRQLEYTKRNSEILKIKSNKRYYDNHDKYLEKGRQQRLNRTPEQIVSKKIYDREYKKNNTERLRKWKEDNIESIRAYRRENQAKRMSDPNYKLKKNLRSRIRIALKGIAKSETTRNILGCDIDFFKKYIEDQFVEGMTWENYGRKGWHVDHKIPVSWFNLSNPNCLKLAFNYKNHQPLFWEENLAKGNKYHTPIH